jgi:hypothetical protein
LPVSLGNVTSVTVPSRDGQLVTYWQTGGLTIKGSALVGLVDLVDGVVTTKPTPAGEIVGTTAIQTLSNKTLTNASIVSPSGLTKNDVGLGNVDNTSDANKPVSTAQQLALNLKENLANKNVANGYAGLDSGGKVAAAQLPASVVGSVGYQGQWDASANSPVMPAASAGNKGWYYVVSVAGVTTVSGISEWKVGDWLVSNGTTWDKIDNTDAVTSVAGRIGSVVLTKADVGLDSVDNTSDAQKWDAPATLRNKVINGTDNTLSVRLNTNDAIGNLPVSKLDSGFNASAGTFWRGDGAWVSPAGAGDVTGATSSVDSEVVLFSSTTGKQLKRATGTGIAIVSSGVWQTPQAVVPADNMPVGSVLQQITASPIVTFVSGTAVIPYDDTIPQWTEGTVLISLSVTPKAATSRIHLACSTWFSLVTSSGAAVFAVFRGVGPSAIYTTAVSPPGIGFATPVTLDCFDSPGAGTFTYTIRFGRSAGSAFTMIVNGDAAGRQFGGSSQVFFYAEEIKTWFVNEDVQGHEMRRRVGEAKVPTMHQGAGTEDDWRIHLYNQERMLASQEEITEVLKSLLEQQHQMGDLAIKLDGHLNALAATMRETSKTTSGLVAGVIKVPIAMIVVVAASWAFLYAHEISENTWLIMLGVAVFPWLGESITAIWRLIRGGTGVSKGPNGWK